MQYMESLIATHGAGRLAIFLALMYSVADGAWRRHYLYKE